MTEDDLASVMLIEEQIYTHPWSRTIFSDCLQTGYECCVYENASDILAYSVMSAAAGEAHLLNLSVHPRHQGRGLGRFVLRQVIEQAGEKADTLFLEVRASNRVARRLYESEGFNEIGQRFNYYPADKGREDALVFARPLL
ncbi:MAG TPA: ribosomal-protein-alanine N-acetyltransferase [Thiolapillus brandeum]|uniref:[Ribosomal protein bS18]-alanine N-acetyltransferase n=1 Tax=Thiolapillus brandeum TaxID=1076588 RepID=A0A831RSX3_9GAMM|nr:ribosomal-protein-alanine N-acetyltransferase [Thiolapillus brandeum]